MENKESDMFDANNKENNEVTRNAKDDDAISNVEQIEGIEEEKIYHDPIETEKTDYNNKTHIETDEAKTSCTSQEVAQPCSLSSKEEMKSPDTYKIKKNEASNEAREMVDGKRNKDEWKAVKTIFFLLGYYMISWMLFFINILVISFDIAHGDIR